MAQWRGSAAHTGSGQGGVWSPDPWPPTQVGVHCRAHSAHRGGLYPIPPPPYRSRCIPPSHNKAGAKGLRWISDLERDPYSQELQCERRDSPPIREPPSNEGDSPCPQDPPSPVRKTQITGLITPALHGSSKGVLGAYPPLPPFPPTGLSRPLPPHAGRQLRAVGECGVHVRTGDWLPLSGAVCSWDRLLFPWACDISLNSGTWNSLSILLASFPTRAMRVSRGLTVVLGESRVVWVR